MNKISVLGIDLAKNLFQLHGVDNKGNIVLRKRLSRDTLLSFAANLSKCLIGMEACGGSNYWARELTKLGHEVKLMAPQFVKPYVKSNKNDMADAEAICEAVTRKNMRFVAIKTTEAQDVQAIHRVRSRLVANKTALMNEIRGLLQEYGLAIPQGTNQLKATMVKINEQGKLTPKIKTVTGEVYQELLEVEKKIKFYDQQIKEIHGQNEICQKIEKIDGVGIITATAIFAAIGNAQNFKNGRQLAAYLGLVPRQHSSGGKDKLLGISKRGDSYLRCLLVHGARSVIRCLSTTKREDKHYDAIRGILERRGHNRACVALANKNARIIWALITKEAEYKYA